MERKHSLFLVQIVLVLAFAGLCTHASREVSSKAFLRTESSRMLDTSSLSFCNSIDTSGVLSLNVTLSDLDSITSQVSASGGLTTVISGNQTLEGYATGLVVYAIPWIILSVITLIVFIGFLFNCLCCKCGQATHYTLLQKRLCILPMVIFGITVVVSAIIVGTASVQGVTGVGQTVCVSQSAYSDFIYGSSTNNTNWVGLISFQNILNNVSQGVFWAPQSLGTSFDNTEWMSSVPVNQTILLNYIYNNYEGSKLSNTNPNGTVLLDATLAYLGPISVVGTSTGNLSLETNSTTAVGSAAVGNLSNVTDTVQNQSQVISLTLQETYELLSNLSSNLISFQSEIDSSSQMVYDQGNKINSYSLGFSITIGVIVIVVIGVSILVTLKNLAKLRFILHIFWILAIQAALVCFILGILVSPASVVMVDICNVVASALNQSSPMLTTYGAQLNITDLDPINVCVNGNGSLSDYYQITGNLSLLTNLYTQTQAFQAFENNISAYTGDPFDIIMGNINNTLNYTSSADDDSQSVVDLAVFNSWSNYNPNNTSNQSITANCSITQDIWVFNTANCPNGVPVASTLNPTDQFGSKVCLVPSQVDSTYVATRYNSASFSGCANSNVTNTTGFNDLPSLLQAYYASLSKYQSDVTQLFTNMQTNFTTYRTNRDNFTNALKSISDNFNNFSASVNQITNQIVGPNGLIAEMNCSFFGVNARQLYVATCQNVAPNVFKLGIVVPLFGFCLLLFTFFTFCMAIRASKPTHGEEEAEPEDNIIHKFEMGKIN